MSAALDLDDVPKPHSTPLAVAYYISKHVLQSADGGPATLGEFNMTIKAAQWMGRRLPEEVDLHRRIGTNTDSERYIRNAPVITQLQKMFYEKSLVNDRADEKEPSDPDDVRLSRQERFLVAAYFVTSMYSSRKRADKELAKTSCRSSWSCCLLPNSAGNPTLPTAATPGGPDPAGWTSTPCSAAWKNDRPEVPHAGRIGHPLGVLELVICNMPAW